MTLFLLNIDFANFVVEQNQVINNAQWLLIKEEFGVAVHINYMYISMKIYL